MSSGLTTLNNSYSIAAELSCTIDAHPRPVNEAPDHFRIALGLKGKFMCHTSYGATHLLPRSTTPWI